MMFGGAVGAAVLGSECLGCVSTLTGTASQMPVATARPALLWRKQVPGPAFDWDMTKSNTDMDMPQRPPKDL